MLNLDIYFRFSFILIFIQLLLKKLVGFICGCDLFKVFLDSILSSDIKDYDICHLDAC